MTVKEQLALQNITISESKVFEIFTSVDSSKACGIDNINPIILKTVLHFHSKLFVTCFPQVYDVTLSHRNGVPIV